MSDGQVATLSYDCEIDTSNTSNPQLRFYYHMYGSQIGWFSVDIFTSSSQSWTTQFNKTGQQHSGAKSSWSLGVITLPKDPKMMFRFKGERKRGYQSDIAVDTVRGVVNHNVVANVCES